MEDYTHRNYLEKQLMLLMPLLRGTSCHVEIVKLESKIAGLIKELEELDD